MKNDLEYLKEGIKDFSIEDLTDVIRTEPLIKGKTPIEIMNDEQKENLRIKLIEIGNLVLELSKMEEEYLLEHLKKSKKSKNIIRLEGNYKEITKQLDDLDIPKDVKERIKSEVFKIFLK